MTELKEQSTCAINVLKGGNRLFPLYSPDVIVISVPKGLSISSQIGLLKLIKKGFALCVEPLGCTIYIPTTTTYEINKVIDYAIEAILDWHESDGAHCLPNH
jgi:hypothetical protein